MNRKTMLIILCVALFAVSAHANQLEITASEITTIEPSDKSEGPRILVKWTLPEGFDKKIIDGAVVTMDVELEGKEPLSIDVIPVTKSWNAATTSWQSGWSSEGGDFDNNLASPAIATEDRGGQDKCRCLSIGKKSKSQACGPILVSYSYLIQNRQTEQCRWRRTIRRNGRTQS